MKNKIAVGAVVMAIIIGIIIWTAMKKKKSENYTGPSFNDSKAMYHVQPYEYKGLGDDVDWDKVQSDMFLKKKE